MRKRYDPIISLFRASNALASTSMSSKGALLESHSGETFYGFNDGRPEQVSSVSAALLSHMPFYERTHHAVAKVLHQAGELCRGATLYMTTPPGLECSRAILAAGIRRVVHPDHSGEISDYHSCEQGNLLLGLNGVEVELWFPDRYTMN